MRGRRAISAIKAITNPPVATAKQGTTPAPAISTPPMAGPAMRAVETRAAFSDTEAGISPGSTTSDRKAWRTGLSTAWPKPRASTSR